MLRFVVFFVLLALSLGATGCSRRRQMAAKLDEEWRGGELYRRMCVVCHGPSGEGYAADNAPGIGRPRFIAAASDKFIRDAIVDGRSGTTMSAWGRAHGGPLADKDVDAIVAFMRLWPASKATRLDESPTHGDAPRGQEVYLRECIRCHGATGTEGPNVHLGNPDLLRDATDGFLRDAVRDGRPGTPMIGFAKTLGDASIEDVVAFVRRWQAQAPPAAFRPPAPARIPPLPLGPVPLNPKGPEPVGFKSQPETTPAQVIKEQLDRGARMVILDARAPTDYVNEHIAGADSVPFYDPGPYLKQLPKDVWTVCYCACPHAESGQLAHKLAAAGFKKVTVLDEGLGYWRSHQFGTRSGMDP